MGLCASCGTALAQGAKFCSECGTPVAAVDREQRKSVTVVFCDLVGSTALGESTDPEALRHLLARYFEQMRAIVERHGGTVEKFVGDAVMAVFGIPVVHEDDALRACRAALEMQAALPGLGLAGRIGVCSGEVVTGTAERLATGDAVNVAARLEQAAAAGEVLLGPATHRLVRAAVEVGEERLLELKGKSQPVAAVPLVSVVGDEQSSRRRDVRFVGRARELRALGGAWQRASEERSCHLFTVLGAAGVGKSRLAAELLASVAGAPVVSGRCLPYGDGITYAPVVEIAARLARTPADPRAATAIASLLGATDDVVTADEIAWAFRKLLEEAAPVVCVFDDLHWAEPTLLDLVEHVADWSRDAPILLLCLARPELLERRSGWGGGKLNATTLLLESLDADETEELVERLVGHAQLGDELRARILAAADGNPLFVEEMLAMVAEAPDADVAVPPTIQALLTARLDQLELPERSVLERASIEGQLFHVGGVEALAPDEPDVGRRLLALVRKELVRPARAELAGDEAFRFRHLLIRDAAYESLAKATRAELHERFADWLEVRGAGLVELDEICGYHLERAAAYQRELGRDDERAAALARRASAHLGAAGERAFLRRDMSAAVGLLRRALAGDDLDVRRELALAHALQESGDVPAALARVDEVVARTADDERLRLQARMTRIFLGLQGGAAFDPPAARAECAQAIELFERHGDETGLALAWRTLGLVEVFALQALRARDALQRASEHALRAGDPAIAQVGELWQGSVYAHGPFHVDESLAWFVARQDAGVREPLMHSFVGDLEAMRGRFEEARRASDRAREEALELGQRLAAAGSAMHRARIELAAEDPGAAAAVALQACAELEAYGEHGWLSTIAGLAAEALYRLGRHDDAYAQTELAARVGSPDDVLTQMLILQVRAKLAARRGDLDGAVAQARRAVELAAPIDALDAKGDAQLDLAHVLLTAGRGDEAAAVLDDAERTYAAKGHAVGLGRVEKLRASTSAGAASSAGGDPPAAGAAGEGGGGTGTR